VLARVGSSCTGTLTISNTSQQPLGWQWTAASPSLISNYRIYYNNKQYGGTQLPKDTDPALQPQKSDTVVVNLSSCAFHQTQVTITAKDTLNHPYQFVIKPS
ncbi:MAG TPA: hypothetical protein VFS83_00095, partial [Ktedonobacterales bacterium]|nr:hypothetical protein [Ktedonobacterales bacterium]